MRHSLNPVDEKNHRRGPYLARKSFLVASSQQAVLRVTLTRQKRVGHVTIHTLYLLCMRVRIT